MLVSRRLVAPCLARQRRSGRQAFSSEAGADRRHSAAAVDRRWSGWRRVGRTWWMRRTGCGGELGVSKPLWGEACLAMGREEAAIAVAIVSAKPADHFRSSPGGYFHGMVAKAKAGELNLARTIWGLRARDQK